MRFCFIIEREYRKQPMPTVVADQLIQWGHHVDLLEPEETITSLVDLGNHGYDAYVLKTVSSGPGQSLIEAVEASGIPTINPSRAIRLVRDKAVAAAFARAHGLPVPLTYFVAHPRLLRQIPSDVYPLVVKPTNGSSCRGIYRVNQPSELLTLDIAEARDSYLLAQRYVENAGYDIKLYVTGTEVDAVFKKSPLHPEIQEGLIPVTREMRNLALRVGKLFGLVIYGLDVVQTPEGLAVLDINDFPSFRLVPRAVIRVAEYILHTAKDAELKREARLQRQQRRSKVPSL